MPQQPWPSIGEFVDPILASLVSRRLTQAGIPHRFAPPTVWERYAPIHIWVPPDWLDRAKQLLAQYAVPEDELTNAALSYPSPDDEGMK
jgi:hypothetical protein